MELLSTQPHGSGWEATVTLRHYVFTSQCIDVRQLAHLASSCTAVLQKDTRQPLAAECKALETRHDALHCVPPKTLMYYAVQPGQVRTEINKNSQATGKAEQLHSGGIVD